MLSSLVPIDVAGDVLDLDPFRVVGKIDNDEGWWNRSPQFRFTNRNKRGLALNLKDPEGQRVIRALADISESPAGLLLTPGDRGQLELAARWAWRCAGRNVRTRPSPCSKRSHHSVPPMALRTSSRPIIWPH